MDIKNSSSASLNTQLSLYNTQIDKYLDSDLIFKRELDENFIWFSGRPESIEMFFKNVVQFYTLGTASPLRSYNLQQISQNFWRDVGGDMARIHSGIPALISKTYANILKPSALVIKVMDDKGKVIEKDQKRLDDILEENEFVAKMKKAIITESWAGYVFFKLSYDKSISDKPIIEIIDPRQGRVETKRGKIVGYKFKSSFEEDGKKYEIVERFYLDNNGEVKVEYRVEINGKKAEKLPTQWSDALTIKTLPIKFLPAFLKNNTAHNSKFPEKPYGESDFANSQSLFHMIDSLLSNLELDVDNSKAIQFVNKNLMLYDTENNVEIYNKHKLRIFLSNKLMDDPEFDLKKMIALFQPELRIEKFEPALKDLTVRVLANAGLSPTSVGYAGYESVNASNLSQTARKENSIISRDEKLELWLPFLRNFIKSLLQFDDLINSNEVQEYNVFVEFDRYMAPDFNTLINILVKAVNGGVMTLEEAVELSAPNKSPEEREKYVKQLELDMEKRMTKSSNALQSFDAPPKGAATKTAETGRDTNEEKEDKLKDLDKYKK